MAGNLRISRMEERHIPHILNIERASQSSPWSETSFRNEINHKNGIFLVAEDRDGVQGFAGLWVVVDEAHVITIAINPERRKEGIGRKLMIELLLHAIDRGATCSTLEVRAGNQPAIKLYEDLGFVRAGLRKKYYPDNKEDAVVMWLYDLESLNEPVNNS